MREYRNVFMSSGEVDVPQNLKCISVSFVPKPANMVGKNGFKRRKQCMSQEAEAGCQTGCISAFIFRGLPDALTAHGPSSAKLTLSRSLFLRCSAP